MTTPTFTQRRAPFLVMPKMATAISSVTPTTYSGTAIDMRRCGGTCATTNKMAPAMSMLRPCSSNCEPWSKPLEYMVTMPIQASKNTANAKGPSNPRNQASARETTEGFSKVASMGCDYPWDGGV